MLSNIFALSVSLLMTWSWHDHDCNQKDVILPNMIMFDETKVEF